MTGFRVHRGGAQALYGVRPDLTCLGKIIGGGLPVGAYGGRADLMSLRRAGRPVYQAGTLSGNPLAVTAGLWSISGLTRHALSDARSPDEAARRRPARRGEGRRRRRSR